MVNACPYTFVKAHRMYNTKSENYGKLWTLDDNDVTKYTALVGEVDSEGGNMCV